MPSILVWLWLLTLLIGVALAASKGMPILNIFAPIPTYPAFYASGIMILLIAAIAAGHLITHATFLGWPLIAWASLIALCYLWVCILYHFWQGSP